MNDVLNEYKALADFLKKSLGNLYDVFVFEIDNNELKLAESNYIADENIEKYFPLVLEAIHENKTIINQALEIAEGKLIRLSVKKITDGNENTIGAVCILMKCSPFLKFGSLIEDILNFKVMDENLNEMYPSTLEGVEKYIDDFGILESKPTIAEKNEIICDLYDMGMFNIKGAVVLVADKLSMSTKSVYRYLSKIKESRE